MQSMPPPGWYVDPCDASVLRYWDGMSWTSYRQPYPVNQPRSAPNRPEVAGLLPDIIVKTRWIFLICFICLCFALLISGIALSWSFFSQSSTWERLASFGIGILLIAVCFMGFRMIVRSLRYHRVVLMLTSACLQFPGGSWVPWQDIEAIGLFSANAERQASSGHLRLRQNTIHSQTVDGLTTDDYQGIWSALPKLCGIRLANYGSYLSTMSDYEKVCARRDKRLLLSFYAMSIIAKLPDLAFVGQWFNASMHDIGIALDVLQDAGDAAELAELKAVVWRLKIAREKYGFDLCWSKFMLDRSTAELAELMVEYKRRAAVG